MSKILNSVGAGLLGIVASCAPHKTVVQNPSSGSESGAKGMHLPYDLQAQCDAEVAKMVKIIKKDPLKAGGLEVRVPSSEYLACFRQSLQKQTDGHYVLQPTENARIYLVEAINK